MTCLMARADNTGKDMTTIVGLLVGESIFDNAGKKEGSSRAFVPVG